MCGMPFRKKRLMMKISRTQKIRQCQHVSVAEHTKWQMLAVMLWPNELAW